MKCLLDMDGVIVDFVTGIEQLIGRTNIYGNPNLEGVWDFLPYIGLQQNFLRSLSREFWAELKPTEECFELIEILERRFQPENVCILSSPVNSSGCVAGKLDWINKYIPQYSRRYLFGNQKQFCAHSGTVLIDDADHNCDGFEYSVLIPRPWNSGSRNTTDILGYVERKLDVIQKVHK